MVPDTFPIPEPQRGGINAITQAGRRRAVGEDVAQVRIADMADDFGAQHAVRAVDLFGHMVGIERPEITRPAATRVELGIRFEQRCVAADAHVNAVFMMIPIAAGEGPFGHSMARDLVIERLKCCAPFGIGLLNFVCHDE